MFFTSFVMDNDKIEGDQYINGVKGEMEERISISSQYMGLGSKPYHSRQCSHWKQQWCELLEEDMLYLLRFIRRLLLEYKFLL